MMTTTSVQEPVERSTRGTLLTDLPPELLVAICVPVGCPTIVWCRLVCRRLRDLVDGSLELRYQIELARDGMTDIVVYPGSSNTNANTKSHSHSQSSSPFSPVTHPTGASPSLSSPPPLATTAARLSRLWALRRAWATLGWTRCVQVPMPGPCCAYELVGGVFCKTQPWFRRAASVGSGLGGWGHATALGGFPFDGEVHAHGHEDGHGDGGVPDEEDVALAHGSRTMSLTWLPGPAVRDSPSTFVRPDLGIPTRDFALDPSQDLVVLFKGGEDAGLPMVVVYPGVLELHVRTLSTNQTHPDASVPVLSTPVLYPVTSVFLQIVDDIVGMMYCVDPARPRITIWNWKTGHLVVDRTSGSLPPGTWDFSFIHSRALFVTTAEGHGSLELFTFSCDPPKTDAGARPRTHSRAYAGCTTDTLVHVASLCLPELHPSIRVLSISTHTGPFLAGCPPGTAFVSSNEARVHVLTVQYVHLPTMEGPRTRPRVGMVVHQRMLKKYLERGATADEGIPPVMQVPWVDWGRTDARILLHVGMFQWLRYVHGQRFVMLYPTSQAGRSTLQVLDFNVRRGAAIPDDITWDDVDHAGRMVKHHPGADYDTPPSKTTLDYVGHMTHLSMPNIFVDVVESGLPYREVRRDVWGDYSGMMIDDERLVGLKYPAFLSGDMKEIDVFTM